MSSPLDPTAAPSSRILIVADDLTGGNACGALFAEAGLRTITVTGPAAWEKIDLDVLLDDYDAVVVNADSRHLPPDTAAELTATLIRRAGDVDLLACRIDTTLRGNVGAIAEAALTARRHRAGPHRRVIGLCAPAFPTAGRTTVQGQQLLHGHLLEQTELRRDVRFPMRTSDVETILAQGTGLRCHLVDISTVLAGRQAIRTSVLSALEAGVDIVIADALTTAHVELVGSVIAALTREITVASAEAGGQEARTSATPPAGEVLEWVTIDPGPGSLALALPLLPTRTHGVILGICGSATDITRTQLATLAADPDIAIVRTPLDADELPDVEATLAAIDAAASAKAIIVATVVDAADLRPLSDEQAEEVTRRLATVAEIVMASPVITGLYATGGDVAAAVMRALGAVGMEVEKEIIPLAVGGHLVGGQADGLPIVTKGGLIGDADTAAACLDFLRATARVGQGG